MARDDHELERLIEEILELRSSARALEEEFRAEIDRVPAERRQSARNLVHYLALRRRDLRPLQRRLALQGLSSLGRAESHVMANLQAVLEVLFALCGRPLDTPHSRVSGPGQDEGRDLLAARTRRLFGDFASRSSSGHGVRIMVTMPSEASADPALIQELVASGMSCMRINCAHDDPAAWSRMIESLEAARRATGRPCKILMDLAGPKLRTGAMEPGPRIMSWKPHLSESGDTIAPARIWLTPEDTLGLTRGVVMGLAPPEADAVVPLDPAWLAQLRPGDRIRFVDLRRNVRKLVVQSVVGSSVWAESRQITYLGHETVLTLEPGKRSHLGESAVLTTRPRSVLPLDQHLLLQAGDRLLLTRDPTPGKPVERNAEGQLTGQARIPCTLPEVFSEVRAGEKIWFDDGKIGGEVVSATQDALDVRIFSPLAPGRKLRADKGINLPESHLTLPALTEKDLQDLDFVAEHADLVGLSFVHSPADVEALQAQIQRRTGRELGVVLKIETRRAFANLPAILLTALRTEPIGVMIARGDLAVECGYERLAEVQEEILWICEAAHVPAIWATQVLETLNKKGQPSRAEITDAAMGERAECVMLNKGPHVVQAVRVLDDILSRMGTHQDKKVSLLRALSVSSRPLEPGAGTRASP